MERCRDLMEDTLGIHGDGRDLTTLTSADEETLKSLALVYHSLGDDLGRQDVLQRALEIAERDHGPNHVKCGELLVRLGEGHGTLGDAQTAVMLLERARNIFVLHCGESDASSKDAEAQMQKWSSASGPSLSRTACGTSAGFC